MMILSEPVRSVRSDDLRNVPRHHERTVAVRTAHILIVEDDPEVRQALAAMIMDCGFEVSLASDGIAALASAERDAPDLVLLDLMLPKRSGITVLDQLKARRIHRIPVVMMSGSRDSRHRELAAEHAADAFLLKPFDEISFAQIAFDLLPQFSQPLLAAQVFD